MYVKIYGGWVGFGDFGLVCNVVPLIRILVHWGPCGCYVERRGGDFGSPSFWVKAGPNSLLAAIDLRK